MSRVNREYAKLNADETYEFAQATIRNGDTWSVAPTEAAYLAAGYKRFVDERPECDEQHYVVATQYADEVDGVIRRRYRIEENPPVVHRYETIRLYIGLVKIGKWTAFESWAAEQTIADGEYAGVNLLAAFNRVVIVRDDHPLFSQYLAAAKTALGVDDATVTAILTAAEA